MKKQTIKWDKFYNDGLHLIFVDYNKDMRIARQQNLGYILLIDKTIGDADICLVYGYDINSLKSAILDYEIFSQMNAEERIAYIEKGRVAA